MIVDTLSGHDALDTRRAKRKKRTNTRIKGAIPGSMRQNIEAQVASH